MSHGLNPPQKEAVDTLSGPMLVLAGAGTGKTRVVTHRIANLIRHGTPPERILAVTFTRKAAGEMQERAMALLTKGKRRGKASKQRPAISTFHSLCVQVLRRHIERLGYPARFAICDRGDQESMARTALREIRVPSESLRPGDLLSIISNWKSRSVKPGQAASIAETDREHLAAAAYRRYQNHLKSRGMVDFDDLLLHAETLLTKHPALRREEADRFDHVLIDEYQDTNGSQYRIVKALAMGHRNLCVVGDDDQSIYGWRGAEVRHILRFRHDWPEAKIVHLVDNYRSTGAILHYANTLIAFNRERHEKSLRAARGVGKPPQILQLKDETDEAQKVVADISRQLADAATGRRAQDFAILCRTNEQPRSFETELRRAQIPYVLMGGMSFFDRKEVRDLLAYLKVVENPDDEAALLRIINTPARGIGAGAVKKLLAEAVSQGASLWSIMPSAAGQAIVPPATGAAIGKFIQLVTDLQEIANRAPLGKLTDAVVDRAEYRRELERNYDDPMEREARTLSIEELINAAANYHEKSTDPSLRGFLDDVVLGGPDNTDDKQNKLQKNAVALMTLHSAKGLEFPVVYMVGMEEGILPHRRTLDMPDDSAIDEERRLCYVGVTRAQEELTLSLALTRRKWGKARDSIPSRFLYEMTGQAEKANTSGRVGDRTGGEKPSGSKSRRSKTRQSKTRKDPAAKDKPKPAPGGSKKRTGGR